MVGGMQGLKVWLNEHEGSVLCFSGGLDSTALLCNCYSYIPGRFEAVFAELPMTTERQRRTAIRIASDLHCELHILKIDHDELAGVMDNGADRCYHCKKAIYSRVREFADDNGYEYVLSGDNYDDLSSDRPGRKAASEFDVLSPLEILGIGRKEIESFVSERGFDLIKDTCMATRYPQGTPLTEDMFRYAERCESEVRKVSGLGQLRVRISGKDIVLQTSEEELSLMMSKKNEISSVLKDLGADNITFSQNYYRTV